MSHSKFKDKVIAIIRMIPEGKVASYGQVALYCGVPRAAREVGWSLNQMEGKVELPWWRVINREGRITIKGSHHNASIQKQLLESEGILVSPDFTVDMTRYRWQPQRETMPHFELDRAYLNTLFEKYKHYYETR